MKNADENKKEYTKENVVKGKGGTVILWGLVAVLGVVALVFFIMSFFSSGPQYGVEDGLRNTWMCIEDTAEESFNIHNAILKNVELPESHSVTKGYEVTINDIMQDGLKMNSFLDCMDLSVFTTIDNNDGKSITQLDVSLNEATSASATCYVEGTKVYLSMPEFYEDIILIDLDKIIEKLKNSDSLDSIYEYAEGNISVAGIMEVVEALGSKRIEDIVNVSELRTALCEKTNEMLAQVELSEQEMEMVSIPSHLKARKAHLVIIKEDVYKEYLKKCVEVIVENLEPGMKKILGEQTTILVKGFIQTNADKVIESIANVIGGDIKILVAMNGSGFVNYITTYFTNRETGYRLDVTLSFAGKERITDDVSIMIADNKGFTIDGVFRNERTEASLSTLAKVNIYVDGVIVADATYDCLVKRDTGVISALMALTIDEETIKINANGRYSFISIGEKKTGYVVDLKSVKISDGNNFIDIGVKYTYDRAEKKVSRPNGNVCDLTEMGEEKLKELIEPLFLGISGSAEDLGNEF